MAICTKGIRRVAANRDWLHPLALLGYVFAAAALGAAYAGLFNKATWFINNEKQALLAIIGIIVIKLVIGEKHAALKR